MAPESPSRLERGARHERYNVQEAGHVQKLEICRTRPSHTSSPNVQVQLQRRQEFCSRGSGVGEWNPIKITQEPHKAVEGFGCKVYGFNPPLPIRHQ